MNTWAPVKGYENYFEVSSDGEIRSLLRHNCTVLKQQVDTKGYCRVRISIDGIKKSLKIHRAVAQAYIPNPNNYPQVNHIDGNKLNNCVNNLEWVTNKQNCHHAIKTGLWETVIEGSIKENERRKKPITAYEENGNGKLCFNGVSEAERFFNSRHICDVLKNKRAHVKGWKFMYA